MSDFFTDYLSDLSALSGADLSCLLCDAIDFDDDAAFQVIIAEMRASDLLQYSQPQRTHDLHPPGPDLRRTGIALV
jgi:hypothetical protein